MSADERDDTLTAIKKIQREFAMKALDARGHAARADNLGTRERFTGRAETWESAVASLEFHHKSQASLMPRRHPDVSLKNKTVRPRL